MLCAMVFVTKSAWVLPW